MVLTEPPTDIAEDEIDMFVKFLKRYLLPKSYKIVFTPALTFHVWHNVFRKYHLRVMDYPPVILLKNGGRHKRTSKIFFSDGTEYAIIA